MKDYPFAGDIHLLFKIHNLIYQYDIKSVVETGTWMGRTAQLLSMMVNNIYTIEINEEYYNQASYLDDYENIHRFLGDSSFVIGDILRYHAKDPILFFLDAHWGENWPLLDELKAISKYDLKNPIVVIHDCYNPYVPDMGYDSYGGQRLDYEYVEHYLGRIFRKPLHYYNKEATGEKRGVLFVMEEKRWRD